MADNIRFQRFTMLLALAVVEKLVHVAGLLEHERVDCPRLQTSLSSTRLGLLLRFDIWNGAGSDNVSD